MAWKETEKGWVQTKDESDNKTLGGTNRTVAKETNDKINEHTNWWNKTPLERAQELEKKDNR